MKSFLSKLQVNSATVVVEVQCVSYSMYVYFVQAQYSTAPLQLREITDRVKQLDTSSVTRQQVKYLSDTRYTILLVCFLDQ